MRATPDPARRGRGVTKGGRGCFYLRKGSNENKIQYVLVENIII